MDSGVKELEFIIHGLVKVEGFGHEPKTNHFYEDNRTPLKFTLEKKLGGGSASSSVAILKCKWMLLHLKTLLF